MEIPNFKDILSKLSVFRNKSLLIPVVIVVLGLLLLIPTTLISSGLKTQMQKDSVSSFNTVKSLLKNSISDEELGNKEAQLDARIRDANQITLLAKQTTLRKTLRDNIFDVNDPNSLPGLVFLQFGKEFIGGIDKMITESNSGDCPTQAELNREIDKSGVTSRSMIGMGMDTMYESRITEAPIPGRSSMPGEAGLTSNMPGMMSELEKVVVEQICTKRAEGISFYVTPAELSGYTFWQGYDINVQKIQAVEDCWYYQLAYWVIEDIFETITSLNSSHENVLSAPVKRLERLNFDIKSEFAFTRRGSFGNKTNENDDRPKYVMSSDKETMLSEPCTGRYCDDNIDVIHFNLVCIVSTKDMMPFMKELCSAKEHQYIDESGQTHTYKHNQITIIESKIYSVDKEDYTNTYYVYGDSGIVELDLICEYIFKKEGYEDLKPESVKAALLAEGN
jgi:hypothetical protein